MSERKPDYRVRQKPTAAALKMPYSTRLAADVRAFLASRPNQALFLEARIRATPEFEAWQQTQPKPSKETKA